MTTGSPRNRPTRPVGRPRASDDDGDRAKEILVAAVDLFAAHGFDATSVRDIARRAGVQPATVYHYFPSKELLLTTIVDRAARRVRARLDEAAIGDAPWERLEAVCTIHLEALLHGEGDLRVLAAEIPSRHSGELQAELVRIRNVYEDVFRRIVADLPVRSGIDRTYLRLALLGAINWTLLWYRPDGDPPARVATKIVALLRHGAE